MAKSFVRRQIAIGDVHGDAEALRALLEEIKPQRMDDFIFLGDLIDRGPDSKGVIDIVLELKKHHFVVAVQGNHEQMLLDALFNHREAEQMENLMQYWFHFGGAQTAVSYHNKETQSFTIEDIPPDHMAFFKMMPDYYETDNFIFVHASYSPRLPPLYWNVGVLRWQSYDTMKSPHMSGKKIYCGHTSTTTIRDNGHYCCIDTGCGVKAKGKLTAINVDNPVEVWQVQASRE